MLIREISHTECVLFVISIVLLITLLISEYLIVDNKEIEHITHDYMLEGEQMEQKADAVKRLFNEYTDIYGRITLYPAKNSDPANGKYDSENQGLWTGEAGILLRLNKFQVQLNERYKLNYTHMMGKISTGTPGLYSRHPAPFYYYDHHNVSKDEYRGFAYASAALGQIRRMNEIIEYGESNDWFYVDDDPYGGFNKDHMGAYRLPTDRGLYKIVAGRKPNIIELFSIGFSAWLNSRKPKEDTSSKMMSWFTFKAIEIKGYDSKILNFFKKRVDKNLKMMYNSETYIEEIAKIYFHADHPFHPLFRGLR